MHDLISRQQAIDTIEKHLKWTTIPDYYPGIFEAVSGWLNGLPSVQPDTTTHDSIPAKTGKNDDDRTSGDCVSRRQAINEIHEDAEWLASQGSDWQVERMERDKSILMSLPSVQPDIIYCKDCKWYGRADKRRFYRGMDCLQKRIDTIVPDRDFCSRAERKQDEAD